MKILIFALKIEALYETMQITIFITVKKKKKVTILILYVNDLLNIGNHT
jgi:hypothetical protein